MGRLAINGGKRECNFSWPSWPVWDSSEKRALLGVLESGKWWYGENVREFERRFAAFQKAKYGITTNNGTTGLEIPLRVLGVGPGDEVIVPAYTFIATAGCVVRTGAKVVFADVLPGDLCIDPADVARKITKRTAAVIPVHFGGNICDMDKLLPLARRRGVALIEDACHAWGSEWKGKGAGALGTCGAFSFQVSKNITSGEGGIMLTDDARLADALRGHTNTGGRRGAPWFMHFTPATNARMTEFQAAILLCQLKRLKAQTLKRQANARILDRGLGVLPGIKPTTTDRRMTRRSYHFYGFRLDLARLGVTRDKFLSALSAEGAPAFAGYGISLYENPLFTGKQGGTGLKCGGVPCPESDRATKDTCWLAQPVLLSSPDAMRAIVRATAKVVENLSELR